MYATKMATLIHMNGNIYKLIGNHSSLSNAVELQAKADLPNFIFNIDHLKKGFLSTKN
jgi:hypothetical protein